MQRSKQSVQLVVESFIETKVQAQIAPNGFDAVVTATIESDINGKIVLAVSGESEEAPRYLPMTISVFRQLPKMFEALIARADEAGVLDGKFDCERTLQSVKVDEVA